ncbi:NAD(P)/FAD-dependent oxidoreductase [Pseudomonas sp.]|uniref:NAD(P)/FAD-dependent oxidoreductase n=1 Tax=Pseudomonas sp. TaxID=306 RepID=UPI003CC5A277
MKHIIIVGAGAVGLSCARAALKRGHRVTVVEQGAMPNPRSASYDQHRMIRYQYGNAQGYTRMVGEAFSAWERLWQDIGQSHFHATGTLGISMQPGDEIEASIATFTQLGIAHQVLDSHEAEALCPQLNLPGTARGLYQPDGGVLFADRIVDSLLAWVRAKGAYLRPHSRVAHLDIGLARVTLADGEMIQGDKLIVATGAWLPGLSPAYQALPTWRQALCYVQAPAQHLAHWRDGPCLTDLGVGDNYALTPVDGTGLKFGSGAHRKPGPPTDAGFHAELEEGYEVISHFAPYLKDAEHYRPLRMAVGYYVKDATRQFHVDTFNSAVVITNCDGQMFKFSSLMGERVLASIDGELSASQLRSWAAGEC